MKVATESKPGYLSTEFWLVIIANVLTQAGALEVPDRYRWVVALVTVVGYALSRGLAKLGEPSVTLEPLSGVPADEVNAPVGGAIIGGDTGAHDYSGTVTLIPGVDPEPGA